MITNDEHIRHDKDKNTRNTIKNTQMIRTMTRK